MNKLFLKVKTFNNVVFFQQTYLITTLLPQSNRSILIVHSPRILFQRDCNIYYHNRFNNNPYYEPFRRPNVYYCARHSSLQTKVLQIDDVVLSPSTTEDRSSIIKLDEQNIKQLSQEFVQSLNDSQLKNIENVWEDVPPLTLSNLVKDYCKLAKIKLTALVVLTTLAGCYMGIESNINTTLLCSTLVGTALTSGSAAAWNHFLEVPFDSQMRRTQNRPLVQGSITPLHAASFAFITGVFGLTILATCVNPLTGLLGGLNLCLYSFVYTPLKRVHIVNTWVGAIVGAIPPIMGFTAINNQIDLESILLSLILYSWQFPHFNALSWNMRHEYARAGYRMMSVTEPKLCQNTALRHSIFLLTYTAAMCIIDMTHWSFAMDTLPFSLYLIYLSYRFRLEPTSQTSRKLFMYSLIYLPAIMLLMVISKKRNKTKNVQ